MGVCDLDVGFGVGFLDGEGVVGWGGEEEEFIVCGLGLVGCVDLVFVFE